MKHFFYVMFGLIHKIEVDPLSQYRFHLFFTWFWFWSLCAVPFIVPHKGVPAMVALGIFEVSLWANFVSHFTAVGAAIAGIYASKEEEGLDRSMIKGFLGHVFHKHVPILPPIENPAYVPLSDVDIDDMSDDGIGDFLELASEPPIGHRG